MASKEPRGEPICAICLEAPEVLKVLTTCKHAFCENCLTKHIEGFGEAGKAFPCPTCHAECPLPEQGIEGFSDCTIPEEDDSDGKIPVGTVACLSCQYTKGTASEAEAFCQECGNAYFCKDCTEVHGRNEATADHKVISLKSLRRKTGSRCKGHGQLINSYCCTCQEPCCYICVLLGHGDHDVKKIWEIFRSLLHEVRCVTEDHERRSRDLKMAVDQLTFLSKSEVSQRRDTLIQEIENHAEQSMEKIIAQKEELKEKVRDSYKVVDDVTGWLGKVPGLDKLTEILAKSTKMLADAEPHPFDIDQLSRIKRRITDSGFINEVDTDSFFDSYTRLFHNPIRFVPKDSVDNIGDLEETTRANSNIKNCRLIFEKEVAVNDTRKYIPSVANLGNGFYAIALPTVPGTPSNAIDIYKIPGDFQRTITGQVNPVYDMTATLDGKLAILSDGVAENTCSVRLFDAETGFNRSTKDIPLPWPLSIAATSCSQYAILSRDGEGNNKVSIVSAEGLVELTQVINLTNASRIACCTRNKHVVIGNTCLLVLETKGANLAEVMRVDWRMLLADVSATWFGEIIGCYIYRDTYKFFKRVLCNDVLKYFGDTSICKGRKRARLSVNDSYIVSAQDNTIRVFEC